MQASECSSPVVDDLDAAADPQRIGRADRVGIEAGTGADAARARAAVAQMDGDAVVRMARDREQRAAHRAAAEPQLHDRCVDAAALAARHRRRASDRVQRCRSAVAGLTITALSQVSLVIGLGSSCSHPLFANRPSSTAGSVPEADLEPARLAAGGRRKRRSEPAATSAAFSARRPCRERPRRAAISATPARTPGRPRPRALCAPCAACAPCAPCAPAPWSAPSSARARGRTASSRASRSSRRRLRGPSGLHRAARSAAARSTPCRRRPAHRSTTRGSALRGCASGRAPMSRRRAGSR